jgi:hypothetical protein
MTAYVDESGNHDLDVNKPGVSALFVCAAVVVADSDLGQASAAAVELQKKHFSGAEIKSSGIGGNHARRLKVLEDVAAMPIGYYATITDKCRIPKDSGLRFKPSFYKRMSRMLYERLLRGISSLHIVADEHGSPKFMASFTGYLQKKAMPSLYTTWTHEFQNSAVAPLIQVADMIAGTLAWCFDPAKNCGEFRERFLAVLQAKELGVERWPHQFEPVPTTVPSTQSEWDIRIRTICQNAIVQFIDRHSGDTNENRQMQVAVLRHMLFLDEQAGEDGRAIQSGALIRHLAWLGFNEINQRKLRQAVIGPLRDEGVIIAGDSNGYRLAMSVSDVGRYIQHDRRILEPMLARLVKARRLLSTGTANQYDMLAPEDFTVLREVAQTFSAVSVQYNIAEPIDSEDDEGINEHLADRSYSRWPDGCWLHPAGPYPGFYRTGCPTGTMKTMNGDVCPQYGGKGPSSRSAPGFRRTVSAASVVLFARRAMNR